MTFTFPDSGIEIDIERVPILLTRLISTQIEQTLEGKPELPVKVAIQDGKVIASTPLSLDPTYYREAMAHAREEDKVKYESDFKRVQQYNDDKLEWDTKVSAAASAKTRLLYAKNLKSAVDQKAVNALVVEAKSLGIDLKEQIVKEYVEAGVVFDETLMDRWLYLWAVCARSVADISAFNTWMSTGSREALRATRDALSIF